MKEALLLVFANKQDIPGAMTPTEVTEKLRLTQLKERMWYVVPSCATTGEGLFEGLVSLVSSCFLCPGGTGILPRKCCLMPLDYLRSTGPLL